MTDTKKTEDPKVQPKVKEPEIVSTPEVLRTSADQPSEMVATPNVSEVKSSNNTIGTKENVELKKNIAAKVEATAVSVAALNETNKAVAEAKPFVKPVVETIPPKTPDEAIAELVNATAESVAAFNKSVEGEKKSTSESGIENTTKPKPEVSRVAPLTGELRPDSENDSYVTPGKVPQPPDPKPGQPVLEVELAPMVISPLTGEVKRADEISFPTPGHGRDTSLSSKALSENSKIFEIDSEKTKFGVPMGHQASLLSANEEAWNNDAAAREDQTARAAMVAEMFVSTDNLRRSKRYQKNLR
jgi:hypothetical protein